MREDPANYYRARECAERAAAQGATCPEARRAHEELAQAYARLVDMDLDGDADILVRQTLDARTDQAPHSPTVETASGSLERRVASRVLF